VKLLHAQRKIANASDPLRVARRILTEKHEKTNGSKETRVKEGTKKKQRKRKPIGF
jgi:hypothetical protein